MSDALRIAVSQRVDEWPARGERRDALDQRLAAFVQAAGHVPIPVPNSLGARGLEDWLRQVAPQAVVLSGGNDPGQCPERDACERALLAHARQRRLPLLGLCRGMQMMALDAGGGLVPLPGHVGARHALRHEAPGELPDEANSFHALALAACPPSYRVLAWSEPDGAIEAIRHEDLGWEGWMWHPEREPVPAAVDLARFRRLVEGGIGGRAAAVPPAAAQGV